MGEHLHTAASIVGSIIKLFIAPLLIAAILGIFGWAWTVSSGIAGHETRISVMEERTRNITDQLAVIIRLLRDDPGAPHR